MKRGTSYVSLKLHGKEKTQRERRRNDVKRKRNEGENDEEMKFGTNKIRRDEVWEKYQGKKCSKI